MKESKEKKKCEKRGRRYESEEMKNKKYIIAFF